MATNTPESDGQNTQTKSKLDTLSREDLIRFVKRQLEHVNLSKMEIKRLKQSLEEKDATISDLIAENSQLKSSDLEKSESQEESHAENGIAANADMEQLLELNAQLTSDIAVLKKERLRHEEDLAAVLQTNNHLRSQLDDALQEAAALREQQTATDVFSLELKDYEKKMVQLNKSLKDTETALEAAKAEKEELVQQLSTQNLQRANEQKSMEISDLLSENQVLKTRCDNLEADYQAYKSRARYVLEQQAKSVESDTAGKQTDTEEVKAALDGLKHELEELQLVFVFDVLQFCTTFRNCI
ncbi:hypothetical protein COOONC_00963 [Cooperia oncophora]